MFKNLFYIFVLVLFSSDILAQSTNIPLNADTYHVIDRFDIKSASSINLKTGFKAYRRVDVLEMLDSIDIEDSFSKVDQFNNTTLLTDNWEKSCHIFISLRGGIVFCSFN